MYLHVGLRDGMGADHDRQTIRSFDESFEAPDVGTRRVPDDESRGQMNDRGAVFFELGGNVFHIAARAATTSRVTNDFRWFSGWVD